MHSSTELLPQSQFFINKYVIMVFLYYHEYHLSPISTRKWMKAENTSFANLPMHTQEQKSNKVGTKVFVDRINKSMNKGII